MPRACHAFQAGRRQASPPAPSSRARSTAARASAARARYINGRCSDPDSSSSTAASAVSTSPVASIVSTYPVRTSARSSRSGSACSRRNVVTASSTRPWASRIRASPGSGSPPERVGLPIGVLGLGVRPVHPMDLAELVPASPARPLGTSHARRASSSAPAQSPRIVLIWLRWTRHCHGRGRARSARRTSRTARWSTPVRGGRPADPCRSRSPRSTRARRRGVEVAGRDREHHLVEAAQGLLAPPFLEQPLPDDEPAQHLQVGVAVRVPTRPPPPPGRRPRRAARPREPARLDASREAATGPSEGVLRRRAQRQRAASHRPGRLAGVPTA